MIGILGSGFGLYGYLPAILNAFPGSKILLIINAKNKFESRSELIKYSKNIIWVCDVEKLIYNSEYLIISYPPFEVYKLYTSLIGSKKLKKIIVEKPVCNSPIVSYNFVTQLESHGKQVVSSYIFLYTSWFINLFDQENLHSIKWEIPNNNPVDSWKWNEQLGGGLLNFYGIHLIAVCAYFDLKLINTINYNSNVFEANFGNSKNKLTIHLKYADPIPSFKIDDKFIGSTPFGINSEHNVIDYRVKYLVSLLFDIENNYTNLNNLMKKTIYLWSDIVSQSK